MQKLTLYEIAENARMLLDLIDSGEAFNESGELNEVIAEQLDLTKKDFELKAKDYAYVIKSVQDKKELFEKEIKRLQEIKKYFENTEDKLKEAVKNTMLVLEIDKFESDLITLSLTKSKAVDIYDSDLIPEEYKRTKITVEPNKIKIKQAILKDGELVPGATIKENKNLKIR